MSSASGEYLRDLLEFASSEPQRCVHSDREHVCQVGFSLRSLCSELHCGLKERATTETHSANNSYTQQHCFMAPNSTLLSNNFVYKGESKNANRLLTIERLGLLFVALGFSLEQHIRNSSALVILNSHCSNISPKLP